MARLHGGAPELKRPRRGVSMALVLLAVALVVAMMVLGTWAYSVL